jgi:DNA repair exonuclease SbcCD ATPase subunit
MRISRVVLRDLGRHRELDLELAPGFTIIRGPNEAGKTTVQRGIELALFRKATATAAELDALRTWGRGEEARSLTRVEFTAEIEDVKTGQTTIGKGILEKEFRGARGRVSLEFGGQTTTDPARADEVIAELTGIPNEAFFRSTASIRHHEMEDLDRDEGALRDRLQGSIGGGDRGSSRAKTHLEDALRTLKARGDKNPGRLKVAEEAVARAEAAVGAGEEALARLEQDRDALATARTERQEAERRLAETRNLLERLRQADRLNAERSTASEKFDRLRQAADAQARLRALEAQPERSIPALRESLERMRTLQSRVSVLQETLHEEPGPELEPDEPVPSYLLLGLGTVMAVIVAIGTLGYGVVAGITALLLTGLLSGLVAGLCIYLLYLQRRDTRDVRRANEANERERALRRQGRVGTEEGLRVAQAGVQNILRELGVRDPAAAEQLLAAEQDRRQEIATLRVQVDALMAGQSDSDVASLRDQAAGEIEQKAAALADLGPAATDAREREKLEAEMHNLQDAMERARDAEAAALARVDANSVDAEQVAGEAERLAGWREQLESLRRRVRIYEMTLSAIDQAEGGTMQKATRFLEQYVARDTARVTGGRYRQVQIDDRTLDIDVWVPERDDWVSASQLSKGTLDQIYLAARMGLVRLVTQGRHPPLILDDPFVTFDDQRAARAALLLRDLSSDFQVIYMACSNRYDALADKVIELPGPTAEPLPGTRPGTGRRLHTVPPPDAGTETEDGEGEVDPAPASDEVAAAVGAGTGEPVEEPGRAGPDGTAEASDDAGIQVVVPDDELKD